MAEPVAIEKNSREVVRLSVDEFKGRTLLSARVWFQPADGGDLRPGRDGWAIAVEKLPEIITGLQQLAAAARAEGLIETDARSWVERFAEGDA
jgi:hypothetical protein